MAAWRKSVLASLLLVVIAGFAYTWRRQSDSSGDKRRDHRSQFPGSHAIPHTRSSANKVGDQRGSADSISSLPFAMPMSRQQKERVQEKVEAFREMLANNESARTTVILNKAIEGGHLTVLSIARPKDDDLDIIRKEARASTKGLDPLEQRNFMREAELMTLDYTQFNAGYRILALGVPNEGSLAETFYTITDVDSYSNITLTDEGSLNIPGAGSGSLMPFKRWYTDDMKPSIRYRHLARIEESD